MKEKRIKELMESIGMENSQSLYGVISQVANEVEQETREKCAKIVDHICKESRDLMRW